jgi:hypothetical protein
MSSRLVSQQPSRKKPVMGVKEQTSSRSPRTFRGALGRPPPLALSSLNIAVSRVVTTPLKAGRLSQVSSARSTSCSVGRSRERAFFRYRNLPGPRRQLRVMGQRCDCVSTTIDVPREPPTLGHAQSRRARWKTWQALPDARKNGLSLKTELAHGTRASLVNYRQACGQRHF